MHPGMPCGGASGGSPIRFSFLTRTKYFDVFRLVLRVVNDWARIPPLHL